MRFSGDAKEIRNMCTGCMHNTAVGTLIKQWGQGGGHGAMDSHCYYWDTYIPFMGCVEEVGYVRRPGDILGHLRLTPFPLWPRDSAELVEFPRL